MSSSGKLSGAVLFFVGIALLGAGFLCGWVLNGRLGVATGGTEQVRGNASRGNASAATREEILVSLRAFQEGYAKRDVTKLDAFMNEVFVQTDEVQLLGRDAGEWNCGFTAIEKFIRNDWIYWGNVRLDLDSTAISAHGDSAWIALPGRVEFSSGARPIRVTGALVRSGGKWKFEQVQFQWLDRNASLRELLHPGSLRVSR
jgi:hypothetical protein